MEAKQVIKFAVRLLIAMVWLAVAVICSAGALNYAHATHEGVYTLAGLLNLGMHGYGLYRYYKAYLQPLESSTNQPQNK